MRPSEVIEDLIYTSLGQGITSFTSMLPLASASHSSTRKRVVPLVVTSSSHNYSDLLSLKVPTLALTLVLGGRNYCTVTKDLSDVLHPDRDSILWPLLECFVFQESKLISVLAMFSPSSTFERHDLSLE